MEGHAADSDDGHGHGDEEEPCFIAAGKTLADEGDTEEDDGDAAEGVEELRHVVMLHVVRFAPVHARGDSRVQRTCGERQVGCDDAAVAHGRVCEAK